MTVRFSTPNRPTFKCQHCEGADGKPKNSYESEEAADSTAEHIRSNGGPKLRSYECPWSPGWHLTKS